MKIVNGIFGNKSSYEDWNVVEYFDNDKLNEGIDMILKVISVNKIDGKLLSVNRKKREVKVGFKSKYERGVFMAGADSMVPSYGRSYNVTIVQKK